MGRGRSMPIMRRRAPVISICYGYGPIDEVLRDVNIDIIFVLFPLQIEPIGEVADRDRLWAAKDYKVDMAPLPKGIVMFDTVRIEYP